MPTPLHAPLASISRLRPLAVTLLMLAAIPVAAADRDRLDAFLEVTGFGVALDSIALSAADAPKMLGMSASDFGSDWARTAEEVFDTEEMRATALDILAQTLSQEDLTHAATFYASDLGQRLVEAENASHMVEDTEAKERKGRALVADMVEQGSDRLGILKRLNAAVDASDTSVRAVQEIQIRFLLAASAAGVTERRLDEGMLRAMMEENRDELRLRMKKSALANAAYTYRGFSDADLESYAEALEHPRMKRVYELMNAVQYEIMARRFEMLAARMAEMHPGQEL
ncbi:DUF2059 domain-containing protein [Roseovarius salinarum]|uniref:DUF2059 domain-containing protein n=1 Tax=Roseovarius salinarum TaxID=1981892 RepID=UPI000C330A68|nr:DUF2059 domain-containing protein [Roseovarius salinarum]